MHMANLTSDETSCILKARSPYIRMLPTQKGMPMDFHQKKEMTELMQTPAARFCVSRGFLQSHSNANVQSFLIHSSESWLRQHRVICSSSVHQSWTSCQQDSWSWVSLILCIPCPCKHPNAVQIKAVRTKATALKWHHAETMRQCSRSWLACACLAHTGSSDVLARTQRKPSCIAELMRQCKLNQYQRGTKSSLKPQENVSKSWLALLSCTCTLILQMPRLYLPAEALI